MKEQECQSNYAFWFVMMMMTICIVYAVYEYFLKLAVRRFPRRGRITAVENEDRYNIIEGKALSKQRFSFKHAR